MSEINAFPLTWPLGKPRSKSPQSARFQVALSKARDNIIREIKLMDACNLIISSNVPVKNDGFPYASYNEPADNGVAVYFTWKKKPFCFACDSWNKVKDNLQAIAKTIEALRGIERWGSGDMLEQAFMGFVAIQDFSSDPYAVLGIERNASKETILNAYRQKAKTLHPDSGGDAQEFDKLTKAKDKLLKEAA